MTDKTVATELADQSTLWTAWVARGAARDRKTQKYTLAIVVTVAVVLAASLMIALVAR